MALGLLAAASPSPPPATRSWSIPSANCRSCSQRMCRLGVIQLGKSNAHSNRLRITHSPDPSFMCCAGPWEKPDRGAVSFKLCPSTSCKHPCELHALSGTARHSFALPASLTSTSPCPQHSQTPSELLELKLHLVLLSPCLDLLGIQVSPSHTPHKHNHFR